MGGDNAVKTANSDRNAHVWVSDGGKIRRVKIVRGLDDGSVVEVVSGDLHEGDQVVIDQVNPGATGARRSGGPGAGRSRYGPAASPSVVAMSDVVIEVRDLTKTYILGDNEVRALRGVSLTIERGEFVAIMGASGSGKSTLMNVIGCLDRQSSGLYLLEGVDVASLTEPELAGNRSRRIGFVFQSFNLLSRTSALENVELPLLYSGDMSESAARARASLKLLGLEGRERNHSNQLSGGQQQRVAIARSLINNPAILLADEPTGNLDSVTSTDIMTTLQKLNSERGVTVILVTHDAEVAEYADRVITLRDGVIVTDHRERSRHRVDASQTSAEAHLAQGVSATAIAAEEGESAASQRFGVMALRAAARALARNKLRSALTMLGIFIGVAALIAMVAVGQGANQSVKEQIASLGTNLLIVLPSLAR